ncbi:PAS domain-containing protein [Lachnospiraceae bacterium OttesenSCG-928-D06]|nr:PAS domain-containing protein [Lachnospiraceae bacterium OttesenSCG-928-D06]
MTNKELISIYAALVPFVSEVCGKGCEIVLHDLTNPESSIVAIENSLTGRQIGDCLTDLARETMEGDHYKTNDYRSGYSGLTKKKEYLSFTYYIKNRDRLIGLLCVNKDLSSTKDFTKGLKDLFEQFNIALPVENEVCENLEPSVGAMLEDLVANAITQTGIAPKRMSRQEKIELVHRLNEQGILMMKGAVSEIAKQLIISEPTVYRYLKD